MSPGPSVLASVLPGGATTAAVMTAALYAARYFGFFSVFPLTTWLNIGGLLRAIISVILALPDISAHWPTGSTLVPSLWFLLVVIVKEAVVGALLGVLLGAPIWAAQGAGDIVDYYRGASLSNTMDPLNAVEVSNFGQLNAVLIQSWIVASGVFRLDLDLVARSFSSIRIMDVGDLMSVRLFQAAMPVGEQIARSSLVMAGPIVIVLVVSDLSLGLIGRLARHFQFDSAAISGKSLVFYLSLFVYVAFLYRFSDRAFHDTMSNLIGELGLRP